MFNRVDVFLVKTDRICDYIPVVSTFSNLTALFIKYLVPNTLIRPEIQTSRYYAHLSQKPTSRCIVLLIPIIGNIIVAICDNFLKREGVFARNGLNEQSSLESVQRDGLTLCSLSEELKDNKKVVLTAVQQNGLALQYASKRLRQDEDVVLAAAGQNGLSIQFSGDLGFYTASRIAEAAVQQNGLAIQYVSRLCSQEAGEGGNALYKAHHLNLLAVKQNKEAFKHIHPRWEDDPSILAIAIGRHPEVVTRFRSF